MKKKRQGFQTQKQIHREQEEIRAMLAVFGRRL
jgi:hypothetical protein